MNLFLKHKVKFIILIIIIASLVFASFAYSQSYKDKAISGLSFSNYNLSGRDQEEIENLINKEVEKYNNEGMSFYYQDKKTNLSPTISSFEPDLAYPIVSFDTKKTAKNAINYGKDKSFVENIVKSFSTLINGKKVKLVYNLEEKKIGELLKAKYKELEYPAQDAKLVIEVNNDNENNIYIEKEKIGKVIDYEKAISDLKHSLDLAQDVSVYLQDKTDYPLIYKQEVDNKINEANELMEISPINLYHENRQWQVDKDDFAKWLNFKQTENKEVIIEFNDNKIKEFLNKEIAPNIDKEPVKADFVIEDGKVKKFQLAEKGLNLKINKTTELLQKSLKNKESEINLIVSDINYETSDNLNLGIKEIIGTGHSSFAISPYNRKHNIRVGAESLDGILIKPGQEFSLIQALGDIDAKNNYLPELVIKDNETVPEYGGGLCQIGTTVFRTALDAGLEITERRNHSYRVSYYEPAGTDATIYSPKPDFRFLNDTPNHIMIQHRIEGNDLYFDFWGTNDGRQASTTYPVIYNIKSPPPTKYVETEDMEPGKVKCTESAHNGADAYFDYTVAYPEGKEGQAEERERRFYSRYIPWQEVCLIGKEKEEETATSTEEVIIEENTEQENNNE
ncbi:MAG TPA: VanW family protein [Patescibacteria group bacterium]|nr:VanW family protein [Patescibacteria group bacterium]